MGRGWKQVRVTILSPKSFIVESVKEDGAEFKVHRTLKDFKDWHQQLVNGHPSILIPSLGTSTVTPKAEDVNRGRRLERFLERLRQHAYGTTLLACDDFLTCDKFLSSEAKDILNTVGGGRRSVFARTLTNKMKSIAATVAQDVKQFNSEGIESAPALRDVYDEDVFNATVAGVRHCDYCLRALILSLADQMRIQQSAAASMRETAAKIAAVAQLDADVDLLYDVRASMLSGQRSTNRAGNENIASLSVHNDGVARLKEALYSDACAMENGVRTSNTTLMDLLLLWAGDTQNIKVVINNRTRRLKTLEEALVKRHRLMDMKAKGKIVTAADLEESLSLVRQERRAFDEAARAMAAAVTSFKEMFIDTQITQLNRHAEQELDACRMRVASWTQLRQEVLADL